MSVYKCFYRQFLDYSRVVKSEKHISVIPFLGHMDPNAYFRDNIYQPAKGLVAVISGSNHITAEDLRSGRSRTSHFVEPDALADERFLSYNWKERPDQEEEDLVMFGENFRREGRAKYIGRAIVSIDSAIDEMQKEYEGSSKLRKIDKSIVDDVGISITAANEILDKYKENVQGSSKPDMIERYEALENLESGLNDLKRKYESFAEQHADLTKKRRNYWIAAGGALAITVLAAVGVLNRGSDIDGQKAPRPSPVPTSENSTTADLYKPLDELADSLGVSDDPKIRYEWIQEFQRINGFKVGPDTDYLTGAKGGNIGTPDDPQPDGLSDLPAKDAAEAGMEVTNGRVRVQMPSISEGER